MAEPGVVTSGRTPVGGCTPVDSDGVRFGLEETGGTVLDAPPGAPTGALEMLPLPAGAFGASNAPLAAPGAVNLLLRSVD
ncbi:hypothetical protein [Umezawaea endophytica]|uniref:Uncharacterized protein n=1 Tax=Umezawaea endophytica TaxID=1654476 RepID=A0A9X3A015_9PSEU|nr:hypothetical protein [Umezawaea endophytica]MCS7478064.1 hypothetical protein [Umezawaea endophytica]